MGEVIEDEAVLLDDDGADLPRYVPNQETIRRECELIRAEWDSATERSRRAFKPSGELNLGGPVRIGS